jgi:MscS family membrane protein
MEFFAQLNDSSWMAWTNADFLGIQLWQYISALAIIFAGFIFKRFLEVVVVRWLYRLFSKTPMRYDEMVIEALGKPLFALVIVGCIHLAVFVLSIHIQLQAFDLHDLLQKTYLVAMGVVAAWAAYRLVDVFAAYLDDLAAGEDTSLKGQFLPLIKQGLRIFTVIVGGLTILATLDVDVIGLLAGLGVGGIAIALAAQDSVGNVIGTINVLVDRPFKVGDWIIVGDKVDGMVEEIGFRSTKVRTWPKTQMSIPNKVLATEIIDNWSRMPKRRVKMTVGVTYQTTPEQMEELLRRIRQVLAEDEGVDQDFSLVRFTDFGPSSLDVFLYYFTKSIKWNDHLAVRERVNLNIMRVIADLNLSIAYPTRTLHIETVPQGLGLVPRLGPGEGTK